MGIRVAGIKQGKISIARIKEFVTKTIHLVFLLLCPRVASCSFDFLLTSGFFHLSCAGKCCFSDSLLFFLPLLAPPSDSAIVAFGS